MEIYFGSHQSLAHARPAIPAFRGEGMNPLAPTISRAANPASGTTMLFVVSTSITEPAIGMEFLRLQVHGYAGGDEESLLVCLKVFGVDEVAFADAAGIFFAKFVK